MPAQAAFLACGFIFLGIIFAVAGVISLSPALGSLRWPSTEGEVVSSQIIRRDGQPIPQVHYRYTVAGKPYTAARVSFRDTNIPLLGITAEPVEAALRRYPVGKRLPVYYDPAAPDRAVLEPGAGFGVYLPVTVGGVFFILGMLAGIFAFI